MVTLTRAMKSLWAWATPFKLLVPALFCLYLRPACSVAEVYYAQDEAIKLAFPSADSVSKKTYILTPEQHSRAQQIARTKIESRLITFYRGERNGTVSGYAAIDTRVVRTLPETFLLVLTPEGKIVRTTILAFHEPAEYEPGKPWLKQFNDRTLTTDLWPGQSIAGIFGSTLTSNATTSGIRKILALHQILILDN